MTDEAIRRLAWIALHDGASFTDLVQIAGLDPATAFRGADLSGVDFGTCTLAGYDFSEADLSGACLDRASICGAIFEDVIDTGTKWPEQERPGEPERPRSRSLGQELAPHLPFLRRYARSLTGSQSHGDSFVRATLEAIVANPSDFPRDVDPRLGLYRVFHLIWSSAMLEETESESQREADAGTARLGRLTPLSRQVLLLDAMEGFTEEDIGYLLNLEVDAVRPLINEALEEIERQTRADVLIIEDEPIIAMELETIVRDLNHRVSGVAATRDEAVARALAQRPHLILTDIQLADDSSGIDAVKDILAKFHVQVIYITGFPERLLTGERPEPTFLITKPFQRSTVKAAIAQALFFESAALPA